MSMWKYFEKYEVLPVQGLQKWLLVSETIFFSVESLPIYKGWVEKEKKTQLFLLSTVSVGSVLSPGTERVRVNYWAGK